MKAPLLLAVGVAMALLAACHGSQPTVPTPPPTTDKAPTAPPAPPVTIAEVTAGFDTTCVRSADGAVACFGADIYGRERASGTPTRLDIPPSAQIEIGDGFFCSRDLEGGLVRCAGNNDRSQLGRPTSEPSSLQARPVEGLGPATRLEVAASEACAVVDDELWCWGHGRPPARFDLDVKNGRFTMGGAYSSLVCNSGSPTCLSFTDPSAPPIASGPHDLLVLAAENPVFAEAEGLLPRAYPAQVIGEEFSLEACVWHEGTVDCAAYSAGNSTRLTFDGSTPQRGYAHICATDNDDTLWCAGSNRAGQLGTTATPRAYAPVAPLDEPIRSFATGTYHTCAANEYDVWCWGLAAHGQTGLPAADSLPPTVVARDVDDLLVDGTRTCIRQPDGVRCTTYDKKPSCGAATWSPVLTKTATAVFDDPFSELCLATPEGRLCFAPDENTHRWEGKVVGPPDYQIPFLVTGCWIDGGHVVCNGADEHPVFKTPAQQFEPIDDAQALTIAAASLCVLRTGGAIDCAHAEQPGLTRIFEADAEAMKGGSEAIAVLDRGGTPHWIPYADNGLGPDPRKAKTLESPPLMTVDTSGYRVCGVTETNRLWCTDVEQATQTVEFEQSAIVVALGTSHTCALSEHHELWCWGSNVDAQFGNGAEICSFEPHRITDAVRKALDTGASDR